MNRGWAIPQVSLPRPDHPDQSSMDVPRRRSAEWVAVAVIRDGGRWRAGGRGAGACAASGCRAVKVPAAGAAAETTVAPPAPGVAAVQDHGLGYRLQRLVCNACSVRTIAPRRPKRGSTNSNCSSGSLGAHEAAVGHRLALQQTAVAIRMIRCSRRAAATRRESSWPPPAPGSRPVSLVSRPHMHSSEASLARSARSRLRDMERNGTIS